jgi:C-terminal processing protease CtpA/Prc
MNKAIYRLLAVVAALSTAAIACQFSLPGLSTATPAPAPVSSNQPYEITGSFTYSNDIITTYYVEHAVALIDMYGFVKRDKEWEIPVASQTLGFLSIDKANKEGSYTLQLPEIPTGQFVDVDNNGQTDKGVQVFSVAYWPNLTGGPYSEGDDRSYGWPNYLASVQTDTENNDEVIGGALVVWVPDANQMFPTGFGPDKLLFTADDPTGPIPAGYSIVDLNSDPFKISQEPQPKLTLYEPKDVAIKDFSKDSYTKAFDEMFAIVKKEYAFNGIDNKAPDWDKLYAEIKPRVEQAEKNNDAEAYFLALRDFTWAFKDGHVGLSGGDIGNQDFQKAVAAGYGFAIRELDDGRAVVIFVTPGGPADKAGMKVDAEVTEFDGKPISQAIDQAQSYSIQSSEFAIRYQKARYLLRAQAGTQATVTFKNKDGDSQTATLTAVNETDSFRRTSLFYGVTIDPMLPLDSKILDPNIGYISINSNYDDLGLIIRLFQRALDIFTANKVDGIIIDMRYNSGGANLGLAGFLTDKEIPMGQLEYYSDKTGKFEPEGPRDKVLPNVEQDHFNKMVLLVGPACFSACELESYGFSQVPGMTVVGQYPTAGVEAEVARGQFVLPEGFSMQIPTGRFTLPDGSIFLEGKGVQPTVKVPVDETTVLSTDDVVLKYGESVITGQQASVAPPTPSAPPEGSGVKPSAPPEILDASATEAALNSGASFLEEKASEKYTPDELAAMGKTFAYTIGLPTSETLLWTYSWCAKTQEILDDNFKHIKLGLKSDGKDVPSSNFFTKDYQAQDGSFCRGFVAGFTDWQGGENHLIATVTFDAPINDGTSDYPAGKQTFDYAVIVKPQ